MTRKEVLGTLKSYVLITFGLLLYCLAWTVFIIPNHMVGGGVTGICSIINYCTGFDISYSFFIINAVLLAVGLKILGGGFGIKTIYALIATTVMLKVLPLVIDPEFIQEFAVVNGKLLCAIIGGVLSAFGISITFAQGGSSGGTDIVALIINKYRAISPGRVILILDIVIIACSLFVPTDGSWSSRVATVFYGYVITGVSSVSLDLFISGTKQSVQIFIFSKKYESIADRILNEMHRGVTVLSGEGWYTKSDHQMLMVIARKHEMKLILKMVREEDPTAFLSVGSVMGVYGKGFETIKK